ncbi:MBL fold metallo-hydrolase [Maribellus sediminis]|uniref:MBL fold metallo-hydrolase n=1 Tax=Maribellus sediminis TaxID=2696285 RepID=UPI0014300D47|nr:MBL fold metallo-hydrolase [Maribellus sediminis]
MKINILTENIAGGKFLAQHGLSYLIEIDDEMILFDTGHTDVFLKNAAVLGFNVQRDVNTVVLSHGHWDHGDGLQFLNNKILYTHPATFEKRYRKSDGAPVGLWQNKTEIEQNFKLIESDSPVQLTENLWYLGEIPRLNTFESKTTDFAFGNGEDDFIYDDSALVAINNDKLTVISGCAHSGICNICEYAKKVTGVDKIDTVIGGFHLKDQGEQTQKTLEYFKENQIKNLLPSHCTSMPAKTFFQKSFDFPEVKTGMCFEF